MATIQRVLQRVSAFTRARLEKLGLYNPSDAEEKAFRLQDDEDLRQRQRLGFVASFVVNLLFSAWDDAPRIAITGNFTILPRDMMIGLMGGSGLVTFWELGRCVQTLGVVAAVLGSIALTAIGHFHAVHDASLACFILLAYSHSICVCVVMCFFGLRTLAAAVCGLLFPASLAFLFFVDGFSSDGILPSVILTVFGYVLALAATYERERAARRAFAERGRSVPPDGRDDRSGGKARGKKRGSGNGKSKLGRIPAHARNASTMAFLGGAAFTSASVVWGEFHWVWLAIFVAAILVAIWHSLTTFTTHSH